MFTYWKWLIVPAFLSLAFFGSAPMKKLTLFNAVVILPYFLIVSSAKTKIEHYVLPIYPFLAIQIGMFLCLIWTYISKIISPGQRTTWAVVLFLLVMARPFSKISKHVLDFTEMPWDVEPHKQGYFLQNAVKQNQNLNGYLFLYEGYQAHLDFYIAQLHQKNIDAHIVSAPENLQPGTRVVVSQKELEQKLLERYRVQKQEEKFGCRVYLVKAQL
jgi:hypothetical protein